MTRPSALQISFSTEAEASIGTEHVNLSDLARSLRTVADTQSITQAAQALGVTYRTLWGRLLGFDVALGCKLVGKSRGRGTSLTSKGRAILAVLEKHGELFAPPARDRVEIFAADLMQSLRDEAQLRLMASHDFAIAQAFARPTPTAANTKAQPLSDAIHMTSGGSVDCIRTLLRGDADLAGYHHMTLATPISAAQSESSLWASVEQSADYWSVPVMQRDQGLIISPRLKGKVSSLADLIKSDVRFINRQRGSGTRLLLDSLLADASVASARISGYEHEEFTHQAVAASIAAGAADVGLGLRAAAAQFKLHFVPLAVEIYRLAGRIETQNHPRVRALITAVRTNAARLPGYKTLG
jgi:putative molybdopterin biosynthesis protein